MNSENQNKGLLKTGRILTGIVLIILGFLGLFLPILQGILFLTAGFILLSIDFPPFRKALKYLKKRFPQIRKPLEDSQRWLFKKKRKNNDTNVNDKS